MTLFRGLSQLEDRKYLNITDVACEDAIQVASFDLLQFDVPDVTSRPDLGDDTLQALVGSGTTLTLQVRQLLLHAAL